MANRLQLVEENALRPRELLDAVKPDRLLSENHKAVLDEPFDVEGAGHHSERSFIAVDPESELEAPAWITANRFHQCPARSSGRDRNAGKLDRRFRWEPFRQYRPVLLVERSDELRWSRAQRACSLIAFCEVFLLSLLTTSFAGRVETILAVSQRPEVAEIQVTLTTIANLVVVTAFRDL